MRKISYILLFILPTLFIACGESSNNSVSRKITLSFPEQALDPGSNTFQSEANLLANTNEKSIPLESIKKAELSACTLYVKNEATLKDVETLLLQFTASNANMKQLAIAENKGKEIKQIIFTPAKDVDITNFIKADKSIAVLEMDAIDGGEQRYQFAIELQVKMIIE